MSLDFRSINNIVFFKDFVKMYFRQYRGLILEKKNLHNDMKRISGMTAYKERGYVKYVEHEEKLGS